jgi:hypothetical protein
VQPLTSGIAGTVDAYQTVEHAASGVCQDLLEDFRNMRFEVSGLAKAVEEQHVTPFVTIFLQVRGGLHVWIV